jgi:DNA polymerase/3'-5' exonuclease PolX
MKVKRPQLLAAKAAKSLIDVLARSCQRIEVAGSLRRKAVMVGDIELVAIPTPTLNLLDEPTRITMLDHALTDLAVPFDINGPAQKRFYFNPAHLVNGEGHPLLSGMTFVVDLFIVTPETWGPQFLIRTGSADFSRAMVTPRMHRGLCPDYLRFNKGRIMHGDTALDTPEERDVFDIFNLPYIPPTDRDADQAAHLFRTTSPKPLVRTFAAT